MSAYDVIVDIDDDVDDDIVKVFGLLGVILWFSPRMGDTLHWRGEIQHEGILHFTPVSA